MSARPEEPVSFSPRAAKWIAGVCGGSILLGALIGVLGDDISSRANRDANSFSASAIGHEAFRHVLAKVGIPTVVSRDSSGRRAAAAGVLVVAEPLRLEELRAMIFDSRATLLVLPKWTGEESPLNSGWIGDARPVSETHVAGVLREAGIEAEVRRIRGPGTGWQGDGLHRPTLPGVQLLEGPKLVPILRCDEGILIADAPHPNGEGRRLRVLADPDLLATHGLGRPGNAEIAVGTVEDLRGGKGAVVLDETAHGFARSPTLWREMLEFPLALVVIQALLVAGAILLAGVSRFGAPAPAPPVFEPGKRFLVENTADLLRAGGHSRQVLARYWRDAHRQAAEALRAPGAPGSEESLAFLDRLSAARGLEGSATALGTRVRQAVTDAAWRGRDFVPIAADIHDWREEIIRGH